MKLTHAQKALLTFAVFGAAMFATAGTLSKAQARTQLVRNGGFEEGPLGSEAKSWFVPPIVKQHGYEVKLTDKAPHSGRQCLTIYGSPTSDGFGNAMQAIRGSKVQGQKFRFTAYLKTDGLGQARAQLWARVDRSSGQEGFFDNMDDRPVFANTWTKTTIEGTVDKDAAFLCYGVILVGKGRIFVDDAKLEFFN